MMAQPGTLADYAGNSAKNWDETTAGSWSQWNHQYYYVRCDTGTATATSALIWGDWNSAYSLTNTATSVSTAATTTWKYWNSVVGAMGSNYVAAALRPPTPVEAAEQVRQEAVYAEEMRQAHERQQLQAAILAEAEMRALALLKRQLNKEQHEEFVRNRCFTVISHDGQRKYRVNKGWSHNVERIDDGGKRMHSLCAHPSERVPEYDNMLAQLLLLTHDEPAFLRVANRG